jgi:hypothetical protein
MGSTIADTEKYPSGNRVDRGAYDLDEGRGLRRGGVRGVIDRGMDVLVRNGVEERGIQPRPEGVSSIVSLRLRRLRGCH